MSKKTAFAAGAIFALVLSGGTAVAATGGNFILGKVNAASSATTLKSGRGPALDLRTRADTPSLRVNSWRKVPRLHADLLDGKDANAFASASGRTGMFAQAGDWYDLDEDGTRDAIIAYAACPRGTQLTGGGVRNFTLTGTVVDSRPLGGNTGTWAVAVFADDATDQGSDVEAYAVCYNPRGGFSSSQLARMASPTKAGYLAELAEDAPLR